MRFNPYPGRGIVIGQATKEQAWLMLYWIMGRSEQSRNRRFVAEGGTLRTEPVNASLVVDPSLIIYDAMLELPGIYLVSNGDQTLTLYQALQRGSTFDEALATREREPDAPHYTPRISAMLDLRTQPGSLTLSILKANPLNPSYTDRYTYRPALPAAGYAVGLTTYKGDGNPLPSFQGDPLLLPSGETAEAMLESYWNALNVDNRISMAVKRIPFAGGAGELLVRNRYGH
ncbi:MAG: inosine monophosphate cyclohydrolase [Chloroflexi bacterium]|nr:MAG: inosine monophosphate cyclohydrolase [Chloroflexota bacterium]